MRCQASSNWTSKHDSVGVQPRGTRKEKSQQTLVRRQALASHISTKARELRLMTSSHYALQLQSLAQLNFLTTPRTSSTRSVRSLRSSLHLAVTFLASGSNDDDAGRAASEGKSKIKFRDNDGTPRKTELEELAELR